MGRRPRAIARASSQPIACDITATGGHRWSPANSSARMGAPRRRIESSVASISSSSKLLSPAVSATSKGGLPPYRRRQAESPGRVAPAEMMPATWPPAP